MPEFSLEWLTGLMGFIEDFIGPFPRFFRIAFRHGLLDGIGNRRRHQLPIGGIRPLHQGGIMDFGDFRRRITENSTLFVEDGLREQFTLRWDRNRFKFLIRNNWIVRWDYALFARKDGFRVAVRLRHGYLLPAARN